MFQPDILTVTQEGIRVQEKALRSIGIYDGSICWGVWYRKLGQFNVRDKYLRVDPAVPRDPRERLTQIDVDYAVDGSRDASPENDSRGLLWRICQGFQEAPMGSEAASHQHES